MAAFKLKSQLPIATQDEMNRILAIPSAQRTATEAAFLTAIGDDYIYNAVIAYDSSGLILQASGITVPDGYSGFKKGATFIKTDSTDKALYENVGSSTTSSFNLMGQEAVGDITLANGKIMIGGASGVATAVDMSGDATIVPTGAVSLTKYVNNEVWVDVNRADTYTVDGSYEHPFKTIQAAITAIDAKFTAAADKQTTCYTVNLASGTYAGDIALGNYKNIRFIGSGVVLSGAITITTSPIGGSGQEPYCRYEFIGTSGIRAEKGKGMTLSGNITVTRTNDSLVYLNFKGCWISGNQLYDTDGTFVTQYENCRVAGTIGTGTFATADSQVLIECTGWNEFAGAITDDVSFYNVDNADFWAAITTTPYFESVFTNTRFHAAVSIVAATNLYMDSYSMKSLFAQTTTLTGQVIIPMDSQAEVTYALSSADILAMNATPITIVPAVAGKTIVVDDICLKMVTTATGYANGGAVEFRYTDGSGANVTADIAAAVITAGAGTSYTINKSIITSLTGVVNSPIVITNADAPFITGTGAGVLTVRYHLV